MHITMRNADARILANAIQATDGYPVDIDVDGKTKLLQKQYKIPPRGRYALARTLAGLRPVLEAQESARRSLAQEYKEDDTEALQTAWNEVMDTEVEVSIHQCTEADLVGPDCDLPPSVLASLIPLVKDPAA